MKKTQTETVMAYITAHPGADYRQVLADTGFHDSTVNALLGQQFRRGKLLRSGEKGAYQYTVAPGHEVSGWSAPEKREPISGEFGNANPLTRLFNECLAGVRA